MESLVETKIWIESNSTFVQGISALASVIIIFFTLIFTIIYVRATFRLVHIPYKSFIKPIAIVSGSNSNFFLKIHNYGPGLAIDVKVIGFINKSIKRESNPRDVFVYKEIYIADGLAEIQSEKDTSYLFPFLFCFDEPFIFKWKSITGKRYKSIWIRTGSRNDLFKKPSMIGAIPFIFIFVIYYLQLPFVALKKKNYFEFNHKRIKILEILFEEGSLSYDLITDKTKRNDEEIRLILSKMKKQGLINFDGEAAAITEKGKKCLLKNKLK